MIKQLRIIFIIMAILSLAACTQQTRSISTADAKLWPSSQGQQVNQWAVQALSSCQEALLEQQMLNFFELEQLHNAKSKVEISIIPRMTYYQLSFDLSPLVRQQRLTCRIAHEDDQILALRLEGDNKQSLSENVLQDYDKMGGLSDREYQKFKQERILLYIPLINH